MPDMKGRREGTAARRPRPKPDASADDYEQRFEDRYEEPSHDGPPPPPPAESAPLPPPPAPAPTPPPDTGEYGFDAETNNRYEEIKRGATHISELQQMTMTQLLKIAKEEELTD